MHADEVAFDDRVVARLIAEQFPQWADLPLRRVGLGGTVNVLYRLGPELVVRLPRLRERGNDLAGEDFDRDARWLPKLARLLPVAVPVAVAKGAPSPSYPSAWGVYSWIDGQTPDAERLVDAGSLARQVARLLHALQRIDLPDAPVHPRGSSLERFDEQTRAALAELEGVIDTAALTAAWERALALPAWASAPVLLHGDLMPANLIVRGASLVGLIDWELFGTGDPAADLAVAWNLFPTPARAVLREELQVDDATWERSRGWALWTGVCALPYYRETNPELAANAHYRLRQVLAPHS